MEQGLRPIPKLSYTVTTQTASKASSCDNLLDQDFTAQTPNQVWVMDNTDVWIEEGWVYLAVFLEVYSRKAVGRY